MVRKLLSDITVFPWGYIFDFFFVGVSFYNKSSSDELNFLYSGSLLRVSLSDTGLPSLWLGEHRKIGRVDRRPGVGSWYVLFRVGKKGSKSRGFRQDLICR